MFGITDLQVITKTTLKNLIEDHGGEIKKINKESSFGRT